MAAHLMRLPQRAMASEERGRGVPRKRRGQRHRGLASQRQDFSRTSSCGTRSRHSKRRSIGSPVECHATLGPTWQRSRDCSTIITRTDNSSTFGSQLSQVCVVCQKVSNPRVFLFRKIGRSQMTRRYF